jgi:RNA polymerase sigma factor (sigma-70 family)
MIATGVPNGWKCGPDHARLFAALEARLRPEIASRARKAQAMGVAEFDDAVQEGRLALLAVVARFDPARGDLDRFARKALRLAFVEAKRRKATAARLQPLQPIHEEVDPTDPEKTLLDRDFVRRLAAQSEKCNERERSILVLSLEGLKRAEIRRRLGLSKMQVEWATGQIGKRLNRFKAEVVCHG